MGVEVMLIDKPCNQQLLSQHLQKWDLKMNKNPNDIALKILDDEITNSHKFIKCF